MAEDLQLRVESKLLDLSLNDLKNVAADLRIVDLQDVVSKIAVIRLIRTAIEKSLGQDEEVNVEFLEGLMKSLVGDPPPLEESSLEEANSEGDSDEDMERRREELEKGKAMVEQVKEEYEAMAKLLKEKESKFKEAQDSLKKMSINIPQSQPKISVNPNEASNEQELATIEEEIMNQMANNNDMMTQRDRDMTEPTEVTQLTEVTPPQKMQEEPSVVVKDEDLVQAEVPSLAQSEDLVEAKVPQTSGTVEPVLENHDATPPMLDEFVNGSNVVFDEAVLEHVAVLEHASVPSGDYGDGWKRQSAEISSLSSESTEDTVINVQPAGKVEEPAVGDVKEHEVAAQEQKVGDLQELAMGANMKGEIENSHEIDQDPVERSKDITEVVEDKVQGSIDMGHKAEVVLEGPAADGHVEAAVSENKKVEDEEVSGVRTEIDEIVDGAAVVFEKGAEHNGVGSEGMNQGVTIEGKNPVAMESGNDDNEADTLPYDPDFKKSVKEDVARWMESSFESSGQLETIGEDGVLEASTELKQKDGSKDLENSLDLQKKPVWKLQQSMELSKENPIILSDDEDDSLSYMSARSELTIASISQDTDADTDYKSAPDTPTNPYEFDFGSNNRDSIIDYDIITTPVGSDDEGLSPDSKQTPKASTTPNAPNGSTSPNAAVATPIGVTPRAGSPSKGVPTPMSSHTPRYQISFIDESNGKSRISNVTSASLENVTSPSSGKLATSPQRISKLSASTPQFGELEDSKSRFGGSGSLFGKETAI